MRLEHMLPQRLPFGYVDAVPLPPTVQLEEAVLSFARAYGACCTIGDSEDVRELVDRLRVFLSQPTPVACDHEEGRWLLWWSQLRDGTLRSD